MELLRLNDIRIGDWFVHVHGRGLLKIFTVETFCACENHWGDIVTVDYRELMPVGLSKGVLEHCGFKEQCGIYYLNDFIIYHPMAKQVAYFDECAYHGVPWRVEYLHQLQHIVYEMTGKELECNMRGLTNEIMNRSKDYGNTSEI